MYSSWSVGVTLWHITFHLMGTGVAADKVNTGDVARSIVARELGRAQVAWAIHFWLLAHP